MCVSRLSVDKLVQSSEFSVEKECEGVGEPRGNPLLERPRVSLLALRRVGEMEGSLLEQGDSQFDFDGANTDGGEAGFGSGWEDDLESMLLKGMKKKVRLGV